MDYLTGHALIKAVESGNLEDVTRSLDVHFVLQFTSDILLPLTAFQTVYPSPLTTHVRTASQKGYLEIIEKLLATPLALYVGAADLDQPDGNGNCPVHLAAMGGHLNVVEYLSRRQVVDKKGWLFYSDNTYKPLPLGKPNKDGNHPVHCAAINGHLDVVEFLTRQGGSGGKQPLCVTNEKGQTIGDLATGRVLEWWQSPATQERLASQRIQLFENDGTPMGTLKIPEKNGGLSLEESLKQVGQHLGVWGKWSQHVPDLLTNASVVAAQGGSLLAQKINDPAMSAAITIYSSEVHQLDRQDQIYSRLTQCLRVREKEDVRMWGPFLYYLLNGMKRLDSHKGTVFRGVAGPVKNLEYYDVCKPVMWTTVTSTSTSEQKAEYFLYGQLKDGGVGTFFSITTTSGKSISKLAMIPDENEVLLPINSMFLVTSKKKVVKQLPNGKGQATVWLITMIQQDEGRGVWG